MNILRSKIVTSLGFAAILGTVSLAQIAHAQGKSESNGAFTGFEQGQHKGHENENGKRKGFDNKNNPWSDVHAEDEGVNFSLTVTNLAIIPNTIVSLNYNSKDTIDSLLADVVGEETDGFAIMDCYISFDLMNPFSDCEAGQMPVQLDTSLTLEAAGLLEKPTVYVVYMQ